MLDVFLSTDDGGLNFSAARSCIVCYCLRRIDATPAKLFADGFLNKIKNPEQELCLSRTRSGCDFL